MTCSRCVTGCECIEARGDVDTRTVGVESLHFYCSSKTVVAGGIVDALMTVSTVKYVKEMTVKLTNGQKVIVRNQARTLQMAIGTSWDPVAISAAFTVIPGTDSVLILGSKTLREKLGIDVMSSLKGKAQGDDRSSGEMSEDVDSSGGISLRNVALMMKGMQAEGKVAAAVELRGEFVEDVMAREPEMFMKVGGEVIARREALMARVDIALEAGLPPDAETCLRDLLLGPLFDGFHRS